MSNANFRAPQPVNEPVYPHAPGSKERTLLKEALKDLYGNETEIKLKIGGGVSSSKQTVSVQCPHEHSHKLATAQMVSAVDIDNAIKSSLAARKEWAAAPFGDRAAIFLKAADLLAGKYRSRMNAATMLGQSKTAHQAEIDSACELIDFFRFNVKFAEQIYEQQPISPTKTISNRSEGRGLEGFVFAVTPFNFTSIAVNLPCAPALMGCSVLWKPAQTSLLSSAVGMELLEEAGLPPGVINFIPGESQMISERLLASPDLAGIHFTGSTGVFNLLWKTVGNNIAKYKTYPRLVGETGGKDFVFAHPSADVDALSVALVRGAFEYQGQKCSAASRAYIPKSLWPKVRAQIVDMTNTLKIGDIMDFTNFMGAVIDRRAFEKISGYIDHAKSSSTAKVIAGGEYDDRRGYFIRPTIIETTDPHYKSMVEEIFGPVLTVYPYDDHKLEETLKLCDESTPYALTGAIFAKERPVIDKLSSELAYAAGNFYVNDKPTGAVVGQQPFGGSRASGTNDKAGSLFNLIRWVSMRTVKENFAPDTDYRYPFMRES